VIALRILHVTPVFGTSLGGIEAVVEGLAAQTNRLGHTADVAHVAVDVAPSVTSWRGIAVHSVPLIGNRIVGWAPGLADLIDRYDILHVHDPQVSAITLNLQRSKRVPAVLSTHGGFMHTRQHSTAKRIHERFFLKRLLRRYAAVLATSRADLDFFGRYSANAILRENGVDVSAFAGCRSASAGDMRRWIYWGRFSRNKRLDALVRLVSNLRDEGIDVELLIAGADVEGLRAQLEAQVRGQGIDDRVSFSEPLDAEALRLELQRRGAFVTATEYEGFGLTVVEAMAAGLVVLCRPIKPLLDFVDHGISGFHLAFDGSETDCRSVRAILSDQALIQDVRNAATMRALSYDWPSKAQGFIDIYDRVIRGLPIESAASA
jgi:alpha-1,3-mannosyltransferase